MKSGEKPFPRLIQGFPPVKCKWKDVSGEKGEKKLHTFRCVFEMANVLTSIKKNMHVTMMGADEYDALVLSDLAETAGKPTNGP